MSHLYSKNGVTTAAGTEIVLLNVDKNSKIIKIAHQITKNSNFFLPIHGKRPEFTKQKHSK